MQVVKERIKTVRDKEGRRETCKEQLRRMCKNIAEEITECPQDKLDGIKASEFMEDVYDIEWITHQDHSYKAARLMVAGGGPNIWVNTQDGTVDGYWGTDKVHWHYTDNLGLDDYLSELHACK
jgi:phospholipase C